MLEFYTIIARKIYFLNLCLFVCFFFGGGDISSAPVSYAKIAKKENDEHQR